MANIKASIKDIRKTKKRTAANVRMKRRVRDAVKKVSTAIASGDLDNAKGSLPQLYKVLDKAAKKGIIKGGTASRRKSRITKSINKAAAQNVQDTAANS